MVRSSIACARCRRSKVKCINTGITSVCKACQLSNRECTYPPSGVTSTPKRSETIPGVKTEESENKKRARKTEESGRRNSARIVEDVLDNPVLTRKVWNELYDIFKLHFSTEMPFLHPPTFRDRMRQASVPHKLTDSIDLDLQGVRVLLLGVLTLTARFHPELVALHSPATPTRATDSLAASEFYAAALASNFGPSGRVLTSRLSLERIQALLMLGLYEWGQTRGLSAWVYVGIAIRLAQSMGLAYEDDPDNETFKVPMLSKGTTMTQISSSRDSAIEKEVRRRTLWSCFIMDRMLSSGKYRPTMFQSDRLRVQLPCSDDQFLFVHKVQTGFLRDVSSGGPNPNIDDDAILSRYIRLVEIWGRFSEWSCSGGRRLETRPPWDAGTEFYKLRQQLKEFHDALPSNLTLTQSNLSAHIEKRNATTYASMHTLYSLCLIMLHREWVPFIPLRCPKPQGPLDEPTFPSKTFKVPDGFWEESAEEMFKAGRDIVEIVRTCQDSNALPESAQIAFSVWSAAFVGVYATHFPHMDTKGYMREQDPTVSEDFQRRGYPGLTVKILSELVPRLKMAKGYVKTLGKMHNYFQEVKSDYYNIYKQKKTFVGGGLEEYKLLEKELKEFGSLEDSDRNVPSDGSDTQTRSRASTSDIGGSGTNTEPMQGVEGASFSRTNGAWAPINATSSPIEADDCTKFNSQDRSGHPYGMNYQQSPGQTPSVPSLISQSNGDSTQGLNSPYIRQDQAQSYPGASHTQNIVTYPVAQHTQAPMAVPCSQAGLAGWTADQNAAYPGEEKFNQFMSFHEAIRMTSGVSGIDNFAQVYPMEDWNGVSPFPDGVPNASPNFMQLVWAHNPSLI